MMQNNFFGRVTVESFALASGEVVELPIQYHDFSAITAAFPASVAQVRKVLPTGGSPTRADERFPRTTRWR